MGKKIIYLLSCLLAFSQALELGQITELHGEVFISRNTEYVQPILASRIYAHDLLLLDEDAFVKIENARGSWRVSGPARLTATETGRFEREYGTLTWRRKRSEEKTLPLAIGYTAIFPGWGHWYIEDYFKAVPMFAASTWLIWNIFSNNPEHSRNPEAAALSRQNYQQIYFVYLIVAIMDVWSETNMLNKQSKETTRLLEDN